MWYHQYQYAEVRHDLYPLLKGKSLPIIQYEVTTDNKKILSLKLKLSETVFKWFPKKYCVLYKGPKELIYMPEQKHNLRFMNKIKNLFNLK